jgi:polyphenol oxidase
MIKKNGILYFETFSQFSEVVHGFSTREFGNMRAMGMPESLEKFSTSLEIDPQNVVRMNQVHSSNVAWVTKAVALGIDDTDGILTSEKELFLSVITADCVPVLLYDPKKKHVGAVHAGWRGVYKEVVKKAVAEMIEKGSDPADILVGLGPCIRSCCYDIAQEHADMFASKFPEMNDCLAERDGKIFLNLPMLVQYQLQLEGIPVTNMEDAEICTFDSPEDLYSCRREGESFGEFVGMIGRVE